MALYSRCGQPRLTHETSELLSFSFPVWWHNLSGKNREWRAMSDDLESCRKMQLMYLQRAKSDPLQTGKWLERAERWAEHARREEAWLSYQRSARQQMNAGAMGPSDEMASQQQG